MIALLLACVMGVELTDSEAYQQAMAERRAVLLKDAAGRIAPLEMQLRKAVAARDAQKASPFRTEIARLRKQLVSLKRGDDVQLLGLDPLKLRVGQVGPLVCDESRPMRFIVAQIGKSDNLLTTEEGRPPKPQPPPTVIRGPVVLPRGSAYGSRAAYNIMARSQAEARTPVELEWHKSPLQLMVQGEVLELSRRGSVYTPSGVYRVIRTRVEPPLVLLRRIITD